ncbi:cadherin-like domain-containing protein [Rhizobium sp. ARZ01]|uniref:cadherin-like domain-containing protein n=1 Tax=Rhizobium sp. ARZ01 TaxID=2769313 RepID=UPI001781ECBA|nr:cadherin-like domain-containing protein [Rhizobium sp. ARZ01]MBD9371789.1 cadherin-like domain-containing protein [Rhizobium sp. ARZ01]
MSIINGTADPDNLAGTSASEAINGFAGDDIITAGDGNDLIDGGEGNDTIDGGADEDTVMYSGNQGDYSVTDLGGGSYRVKHITPGAQDDGTDVLTNIEFLNFNGTTYVAIADAVTNQAPTGTGVGVPVADGVEDTPYTVSTANLVAEFSDPDGDPLSISAISANNGATVTPNEAGDGYTVKPAANFHGIVTLTYTVSDNKGGDIAHTRWIEFVPDNDEPTGTPDAVLPAGTEDTPYTVSTASLLSGMTDGDGDPLSITAISADEGAEVTADGAGGYTVKPAAHFNGTVTLTYTVSDGKGGETEVTQTVTFAAVEDEPTGGVTITGTAIEDGTLTANVSTLDDADGLNPADLTYQWMRGDEVIPGANGASYTLGQDDVGAEITVVVSYTDGEGNAETVTSPATPEVANVNDPLTGTVTIEGEAIEDGVLEAIHDDLDDPDGPGTITYQWMRGDDEVIEGATGKTYTLTQADVGAGIWVVVYHTDQGGTKESIESDVTDPVEDVLHDPDAVNDAAEVFEYGTVSGNVKSNDTDADDDPIAITSVSGASGTVAVAAGPIAATIVGRYGTLNLLANGMYSYEANDAESLAAGQNEVDVFTYTVSDGKGGTDTATLTITVKGTNDGTNGNDLLRGADQDESFSGGIGDDIIDARGGDDVLNGGDGDDILKGASATIRWTAALASTS